MNSGNSFAQTPLKVNTRLIKQVTSVLLVLAGLFNIFTVLRLDLFVRWLFP